MKTYLENHLKGCQKITKIRGEASCRTFFRVKIQNQSLVAMVYPQANPQEIKRIIILTQIFRECGIHVPEIHDVLDDRIILQQDLGDLLVQRIFRDSNRSEKESSIQQINSIILQLREISIHHTQEELHHQRMQWELNYFIQHFVEEFYPHFNQIEDLKAVLNLLVLKICNISFFAHRDFHCRNMLFYKSKIYLVDFQDSLVAPEYYDLASFIFDAYLDLKQLREWQLDQLQRTGLKIDREQLYLTALQRNLKALGTFGYQIQKICLSLIFYF